MKSRPPVDAELSESAARTRMIGRFFFDTHAGAALASAAILALLPPGLPPSVRAVLVGGTGAFALLCALAARLSGRPRFPLKTALTATAIAAIALASLTSALLGEGLRGAVLAFCGPIVCVVGAITGVRRSLVVGAAALAILGALAWAEATGLVGGLAAPTPLRMVLLYHGLVVVCGALAGALISRVLDHYLHTAAEREQRFRGLLRIAANWYWEQDKHFRFTYVSEASTDLSGIARSDRLQRAPWEIADMGLSDEQLDAHRADLEAHRPFTDLLARRRGPAGQWRTVSISGEPKFDANGAFSGYWGVARDVTDEVLAQRAVAASETRYRELFTRSPSPLFLHRRGMVFDANEAAARLFGFPNAAAMNGLQIVTLFPAGPTRERVVERMSRLDAMPVGEGLPVTDFLLRAVDGRALSVQATAVRVDTASGPANLSIFFDITARKAVEGALRRSEAMLSHLFATSPDCITLTEMATGRYAMVNAAFTRLTGYRADEAVGRTALELGLWHDPGMLAQLLAALEHGGKVVDMPAEFVTRRGERVSTLVSAGRFAMDQRDYLVLNTRDVTVSER
ncbi:MAG TPA: PAS domain-containing protein, partial [Burkholderiaceae bacterium]|nr:PAS domain-containing protein [Burkholderiaceae bacterium]